MSDEQLIASLRAHAHDDCGGEYLHTHICNVAADRLETLIAREATFCRAMGLEHFEEQMRRAAIDADAAFASSNREVERLREALMKIASCESRTPGDVVDIARQALLAPPADDERRG